MPKRRYIRRTLVGTDKNFYIVDAGFLANKYLPLNKTKTQNENMRIANCKEWWNIIEAQIDNRKAIVYIPDICIEEVIKVFAKKYYSEDWFSSRRQYNTYVYKFLKDIRISHKELSSPNRHIRYHDIPTSRDILISVERFNRIFNTNGYHTVSVPDLIIVSTAKYLIDFFNLPYDNIHILTTDRALKEGTNKISEIPNAYDPSIQKATSYFK